VIEHRLDSILRYNMTPDEASAYQLAILWSELVNKHFPSSKNIVLRSLGDPRKSILFKYCYKLYIESRGIINEDDFEPYMLAQITILKAHNCDNISPQSLVGEKAWKRWQVWQSKYQKAEKKAETTIITASNTKIKADLDRSRAFLEKRIGEISKKSLSDNKDNVSKWLVLDKVSPLFVLCFFEKTEFNDLFGMNSDIYDGSLEQAKKLVSA